MTRAEELLERLKQLRDEGPEKFWCSHGVTLVQHPPGDGTLGDWFKRNRRFPQYWLHVYYLANSAGAKGLFLSTLAEVFVDRATGARERLYRLGVTGDLADHEEVGQGEDTGLPSTERALYILLWRTCVFLRDQYTLAPCWATEVLIMALILEAESTSRDAELSLGEYWRSRTTLDQWSGRLPDGSYRPLA